MYRFIEENFYPQQKYMQYATRASSIQWTLSTGELKGFSGIHEFPFMFIKYIKNLDLKKRFIQDCFPSEIFDKINNKALMYLQIRNGNHSKSFIMVTSFSNNGLVDTDSPGILIQAFINQIEDTGIVTLYRADAIAKLNDKILLIVEVSGEFKGRIAFACSMYNEDAVLLINNEYDILQLLSKGYSSEKIAQLLNLSKHTVNDIRKELLNKFKAQNLFQLIYHAHQEGYI